MDSPSTTDEDLKTEQDQHQPEDSSTSDLSDTVKAEDSSNSNKSEDEQSTFDVVMKAIDGDDSETEDESESNSDEDDKKDSKEPSEDGEKEDKVEDEFEDFSPEERANLKKATAERFDKLKGLYHKSKEEKEALNAKLEEITVDADNYKQFTGFLEQNRISENEANELFNIGALMKNDPIKALELITPHYQQLLQVTGSILPPDLQQQVEQGYLTQAHAAEISRSRAMGQTTQAISREQQEHQQRLEQTRQQQETVNSIQSAITDWEKKWSSSDPDYSTKKDRVLERVELMLARASNRGEMPKTVDDAIRLAEDAKKHVEKDIRQFMPKRKINTVDGGSSVTTQPEPKDTIDVIRRTLNQTNA